MNKATHNQIFQDLEPLVIRGKGAHIRRQQERDGKTASVKKTGMSDEAKKMANLANDTESTKVKTVSKDVAKRIRETRNAKKMTQKQLAAKVPMLQTDLQKYENGTALPNMKYLQKLQILLGVKLLGLDKKPKQKAK